MDKWACMFLVKLDMAGWKLWASVKYVDDVNVVAAMVDVDLEWKEGALCRDTTKAPAQALETREAHSMRLIQEAADSVYPMLRFTVDLPQNHGSGMVPMLDLQVWVEHHPAGSGAPAGEPSQQGPRGGIWPLPAGTEGDPAVVESLGPLERSPAGPGAPAGRFSQQGLLGGIWPLPAGTEGDPAVVTKPGSIGAIPCWTWRPAGRFSQQGLLGGIRPLPAGTQGDPAEVESPGHSPLSPNNPADPDPDHVDSDDHGQDPAPCPSTRDGAGSWARHPVLDLL